MTTRVAAPLAVLLLSLAPATATGAEPLFLVGAPAASFKSQLSTLARLGRYCALAPAAREARVGRCLRAPGSAEASRLAAEVLCREDGVELGHPAEQRLLDEALERCEHTEEATFTAPAEPARGPALLGPAGLESAIVGGLADFVVDRARSESIDFALDQVEAALCRDQRARQLFPALCALASAASAQQLALVPGRMLHDAVASDLQSLARHLADLADQDPALRARQELSCALRLADAVSGGLARREPPLGLALAAATRLTQDCPCRALLDGEGDCTGPASRSDAAQALLLALQLAVARAGEPGAGAPQLFLDAGAAELRRAVVALPVRRRVRDLAGPAAEALLGPALRIRLAVEASLAADPASRAATLPEVLAAAVDFIGAAIDQALAMRPATPAVAEQRRRVAGALAVARHALSGEYATALTDLVASELVDPSREPYGSLLRVSSLLVEVGSARSSAEVARALEAAASPAGSWRLRRKKAVWGLSAQVGVAVSREWVQGTPAAPPGTVLGFHAPIGLDASWPLGRSFTVGGMLQVLDLGTLVGARVQGGGGAAGAKDLPEAGFAQVFSPGGTAFLGLGKSPFVLSLGGAFSPGLRPVTSGDARNVWRVTAGLAVDVPIFMW